MIDKLPPLKFNTFVSASDVLQKFIDRGIKLSPRLAMTEIRNIAEAMVLERAARKLDDDLRWQYQEYITLWGEIDGTEDAATLDAYTEGLDNLVEQCLLVYEASITQDFIGRASVDTRLHSPVVKGPDEIALLAAAFAKDVWRCLIHDFDEENDTHVLSTAKILSAAGIIEDDVKEILGDMAGPEKKELSPKQELKDMPLRDINEILNEVVAHVGENADADTLKQLFDMAIDTDEGISASGLSPLGLDDTAAPTLRLFAAKFGADAPDEFVQAVAMGPYEANTLGYQLHADEPDVLLEESGEETDPDMRALMGLPPLPVAAPKLPLTPKVTMASTGPLKTPSKLPGVPALPKAPGLPPAPAAKPPGLPKLPAAAPTFDAEASLGGVVDKGVLQMIRKHVKVKDEDIASGLGIARQTFINYADDSKKAVLNASPEQHVYLRDMLNTAIEDLQAAQTLLG